MAFLAGIPARQAALVAGDAVLVGFDAVGLALAVVAQLDQLRGDVEDAALLFPAERQVGRRHDFHKVHVVVGLFVRLLLRVVQRVQVVVRPRQALFADAFDHVVGQLGPEAQVVDFVGEGVLDALAAREVVLQVVDVHVAVAERFARGEVEVSHHLVDADAALDPAALPPLLVQVLAVVFPLALLDILAPPERPADAGVRFPHFGASVAAASLGRVRRRRRSVTLTAVLRVQMLRGLALGQLQGFALDGAAALALRPQAHLVDTVHDAGLDLARDVHDIEREQLAGHARERDVHVDLHLLAAALVDHEFRVDDDAPVVGPLAPC